MSRWQSQVSPALIQMGTNHEAQMIGELNWPGLKDWRLSDKLSVRNKSNVHVLDIKSVWDNSDSIAKGLMQKEQWDMPEFQDMAGSKKREAKIFTFYRNEGEDTVGDNEENREVMFDLDDIHEIEETELPPLICKMGKSSRN
ncbi:hypothetical protein Tco_1094883 [Tanacetum coccineum]